ARPGEDRDARHRCRASKRGRRDTPAGRPSSRASSRHALSRTAAWPLLSTTPRGAARRGRRVPPRSGPRHLVLNDISVRYIAYAKSVSTTSLDLAVLGHLKEGSMHGYELRKRLAFTLGPLYAVSYGSLYPCL